MIKSVISIDGFPQGSRFMRKRSWLLWLCPPCRVVEEAKRSPVGLVVPLKVSQDHHVDTLKDFRVLEDVQWIEEGLLQESNVELWPFWSWSSWQRSSSSWWLSAWSRGYLRIRRVTAGVSHGATSVSMIIPHNQGQLPEARVGLFGIFSYKTKQ